MVMRSAGSAVRESVVKNDIEEVIELRLTPYDDCAEKTQVAVFDVAISSAERHGMWPRTACSTYHPCRPSFPRPATKNRGSMPSIHDVYRPFLLHFRRARMQFLQDHFQLTPSTRVLDVGGTLFNWTLAPVMPTLTLLNIEPRPADLPAEIEYVQGDARHISCAGGGATQSLISSTAIRSSNTWVTLAHNG